MNFTRPSWRDTAFYYAFGSVVATIFSIAVSQTLLGLAIAALLIGRERPRIPPVWLPIGLFMLGTIVSLAASADPWAGRGQIKKFFVLLMLVVVYTTFRSLAQVRALVMVWTAAAAVSAVWSLWQFYNKWDEAYESHRSFYEFYNGARITGLLGHWMTFGGVEMIVLLMGLALLFYSPDSKWKAWLAGGCALLSLSLLLGWTRSIWLGTGCGALYLLWNWRRWVIPAVVMPLALAVLWINPLHLRDRAVSAFFPHGDVDSNGYRIICLRTGAAVIRAHPWLGLGPDSLKTQFKRWIPADIPPSTWPDGYYQHLENLYFQYAAERGIPTLLMLLWMLGKMLVDYALALRKAAVPSEARFVLHGCIAVLIGTLVAAWYEVNLGDSEVLGAFLGVAACGYVGVDAAEASGA
jgi:O-antigen ligase